MVCNVECVPTQIKKHVATDIDAGRAEIKRRYARHRKLRPFSFAAKRLNELNRYLDTRYGPVWPDDDASRDDLEIVAHHLAQIHGDRAKRFRNYCADRAPWLSAAERDAILAKVEKPIKFKAGPLGKRIGLSKEQRAALKITTIRAHDATDASMQADRRAKDKASKERKRRSAGAKPQAESAARNKPWILEGVSRATYYRRKSETVSSAANENTTIGVAKPVSGVSENQVHVLPPVGRVYAVGNEPPPPGYCVRRDPRTGDRYFEPGIMWEPPPFVSKAPRRVARKDDFDGHAFHLSAPAIANLKRKYPAIDVDMALHMCDAWFTQYPAPKDGKMNFRIDAFLRKWRDELITEQCRAA